MAQYQKPNSAPLPTPDKDNLQRLLEALKSDGTLTRVTEAIKASGTKKREGTVEVMAKSFVADAVRQVSDEGLEAHAALTRCTAASVVNAVEKLAAWGIPPNHVTQEGWLLGRNNNKLGVTLCVAMPGVRGLERLLCQHGAASIKSIAVRRQDHFECIEGTHERVEFRRCLTPDTGKPNDIIGACAIVKMKDGREQIVTMPITETELAKQTNVMTLDAAARYRAQRSVMKEAMRTFLIEVGAVRELLEYDQQHRVFDGEDASKQQAKELVIAPAAGIGAATGTHAVQAAGTPAPEIKAAQVAPEVEMPGAKAPEIKSSEPVENKVPDEAWLARMEELLQVKTGAASKTPNTALGQVKEDSFARLVSWVEKSTAIPASEWPFADAVLESHKMIQQAGISFSEAKNMVREKVVAGLEEANIPAGMRA
jgi:recombinational DNA repair protein RecT